ncbi:MAG: 4-alpha-glucanotransferase [Planctomycetota bacterium]
MNTRFTLRDRACGLLLHPTSLPGRHGSGDLGPGAHHYVDFLADAGQRWWQMLPTGPPGAGNSPYSSSSALAGSPLLISLDKLVDDGLLSAADTRPVRGLQSERVCYGAVTRYRLARLLRAFRVFVREGGSKQPEYQRFLRKQRCWLEDYALFAALKQRYGGQAWIEWPRNRRLLKRAEAALVKRELNREIDFQRFIQFKYHQQWTALRDYAHKRGVGLIGDMPIFVALDSSDVWAHRRLFDLYANGRPKVVSGVPPDLFTRDGQLWGHPHYCWPRHRATHFAWWLSRFTRAFEQFDAVRIDHFLGFHRCWAVPGQALTARHGRWVLTPGKEMFEIMRRKMGRLEIIAEDLGVVTKEALALRDRLRFPGMRLLQFAFGDDEGARYHQPQQYPQCSVVYTGTHDNDTTLGWFQGVKAAARKWKGSGISEYDRLTRYLDRRSGPFNWHLIRLAYQSVARTAIIPMQDVLDLDKSGRMNRPGTPLGNWEWRMSSGSLSVIRAARLRGLAHAYERLVV